MLGKIVKRRNFYWTLNEINKKIKKMSQKLRDENIKLWEMKIHLFKLIRMKVYLPNCYIFYKKCEINFQILNLL